MQAINVFAVFVRVCRLKAKAGKLWSRAQVLVNKKVSVLNLFFKY